MAWRRCLTPGPVPGSGNPGVGNPRFRAAWMGIAPAHFMPETGAFSRTFRTAETHFRASEKPNGICPEIARPFDPDSD
jgi:hypothetical protein